MEKQIAALEMIAIGSRCLNAHSSHPRFFLFYLSCITLLFIFFSANHTQAQPSNTTSMLRQHHPQTLAFDAPVNTIITLAPHATELVYSAGAGNKIIGTVEHSDFPEEAKKITRIGDAYHINLEHIIALNPDLIIAWTSGNNAKELLKLHDLGFKIYYSENKNFEDIARDIKTIGHITGTEETSQKISAQFTAKINHLRTIYSRKPTLTVFYQLWHNPLMTVNQSNFINQSIRLCGGVNVFANSPIQVPQVSIESILQKNPDVIIAGHKNLSEAFNWTYSLPQTLPLTQALFIIDPDLLHRPTARLAQGTEALCKILDSVRKQS